VIITERGSPRWLPVVCIVAGLLLCVAACSSDTSTSSSASATTDTPSSPGLSAAKANVEQHTSPPASIGPTTPIGKPIPTGKRIVYIDCGVEGCILTGNALEAAAKVLDWQIQSISATPTPQGIQAAFDAAIRLKPDAVVADGFPEVAFTRQLAQLKAMNIPYISINSTDPVGNGLVAQLVGPSTIAQATTLVADKTIVDSGGHGEIGVILLTGYPIVADYTTAYTEEIAKNCPGCTTKTLQLQPSDIDVDAAAKITSFLQANPGIKYLFFSYYDLASGLATALKNAGISPPKTYAWSLGAAGTAAVRDGDLTAGVPQDYVMQGWQIADTLARQFTGESLAPDNQWAGFVLWSTDYNNVPAASAGAAPATVADYQQQFMKLWGK
jgi:ABC-type sugar transport system substrate-binding protein